MEVIHNLIISIIKRLEELIELEVCLKHKYNQMVPSCPKRNMEEV
jgi:hypothetical protein